MSSASGRSTSPPRRAGTQTRLVSLPISSPKGCCTRWFPTQALHQDAARRPPPILGRGEGPHGLPPYLWAGLVSLGALVLYVLTLAPTPQFWDTSECIAAAYVLGIPPPPGNPLFVLTAHVGG